MTITVPQRRIGNTGLHVSELGFGAAPLGNLYRPISDDVACGTLKAALDSGITYVDTAPYYGFGLSERRVGDALRARNDIVLSTKVGRLLRPTRNVKDDNMREGFRSAMPFEPIYDYGYSGVMRSFEDSLQRLGLPHIDLLFVHDIGVQTHATAASVHFASLTKGGGLRALAELRSSGAIRGFGIGVNEIAACLDVLNESPLDVILLAGRYTLLEQNALDELLPKCLRTKTSVVIGGPYNSGILATGTRRSTNLHYNYAPPPSHVTERVARMEAICGRHGIPLAAAALQFPLAHPSVVSVIPGLDSAERAEQTLVLYRTRIPAAFWSDMLNEGLIHPDAPLPFASQQ